MYDVIVIGAGAAGMIAAGNAAKRGKEVLVLEKNEQVGKKLLITGKGRCNLTNDCIVEDIIANFPGNGSFLYSSLYYFDNQQLIRFFESLGVATKVERGKRVFPKSDDAADVVAALKDFMLSNGAKLKLEEKVDKIEIGDNQAKKVITVKDTYQAEKIILTTGGQSYPGTGSSGDGYQFAKTLGHKIIEPNPALVPLESNTDWVSDLQGLQLKNITAKLYINDNLVGKEFGELLFAHYGLTGPIILTLSRKVGQSEKDAEIEVVIDLKPALTKGKLDDRIQRDFKKYSRKQFKNSLGDLLPAKLIPVIVDLVAIPARKEVNQITAKERNDLVELLKGLKVEISGTRGFKEAIVTAGGVDVKEVNPSSMESKIIPGVFFAGELIDIDGYTGGFNLQAAFSTGKKAGLSV